MVGELELWLSGDLTNAPQQLTLEIIHPTDIKRDISVKLRNSDGFRYVGQLEISAMGRRYIQLSGNDPKPWRLKSELTLTTAKDSEGIHFQLPK